jgi:peptidyl-prolyl cis-trans isomerase B (cyclophilin B)
MSEATPAYSPAPAAKTNVLAIVSLITSIVGMSLIGVITGHIGLNQIKKTGEAGRGLALAGVIIGYIGLAIGLIFVILWIGLFAFAGATGNLTSY